MTFKKSNTGNATQTIAFNSNIVATCSSCIGVLDVTTSADLSIGIAFDGLLGEAIFFNRSLDSKETSDIEKYLKTKWSIID
ncbi:MAG: hypothetical protein FJ368_03460 [Pelagibacterales bacterium]|nr:hypothetical protein [Pelagibacterales bacterium]